MSDVRQKAKDLLKLALEGSTEGERNAATVPLLRLIDKYDLLSAGGKPINVAASILERVASLDMEDIASHAEKIASGVERIFAASKRVTDRVGRVAETRELRERGRRRIR